MAIGAALTAAGPRALSMAAGRLAGTNRRTPPGDRARDDEARMRQGGMQTEVEDPLILVKPVQDVPPVPSVPTQAEADAQADASGIRRRRAGAAGTALTGMLGTAVTTKTLLGQ